VWRYRHKIRPTFLKIGGRGSQNLSPALTNFRGSTPQANPKTKKQQNGLLHMPTPATIQTILAMDAQERFEYFIQTCVETGELWGLRNNEGWCGMGTEDGGDSIPFWPAEPFAALMADEEWSDCSPESIPLDGFLEEWLPGMHDDGVCAAVFPIPGDAASTVMDCVTLEGQQLYDALMDEYERHEKNT